jgi:hypothetical protein
MLSGGKIEIRLDPDVSYQNKAFKPVELLEERRRLQLR